MRDCSAPHRDTSNRVLLVGLGNPGLTYRGTRHNLGREVLDQIAKGLNCSFRANLRLRGQLGVAQEQKETLILFKPSTWMNECGPSVRATAQFYQLAPEQILVIADDVALPFGNLRLRLCGSSGGHNGLKSVKNALDSDNFARLRVGIGCPTSAQALDSFVLGQFPAYERSHLPSLKMRACEGALAWVHMDGQSAMNWVNAKDFGI